MNKFKQRILRLFETPILNRSHHPQHANRYAYSQTRTSITCNRIKFLKDYVRTIYFCLLRCSTIRRIAFYVVRRSLYVSTYCCTLTLYNIDDTVGTLLHTEYASVCAQTYGINFSLFYSHLPRVYSLRVVSYVVRRRRRVRRRAT